LAIIPVKKISMRKKENLIESFSFGKEIHGIFFVFSKE